MPVRAAAVYFGIVFAAAFAFGVLRMLVLTPLAGPLPAVMIEVPLVLVLGLGLAWAVAGVVLRRWPLRLPGRVAMGGLAFALLMAAEAGLVLLFGQSPARFVDAMATPAGALGLAGQIGFAILPALR